MEDLLQVGVITSTHGIRGEVKVFPTTDDVSRFKKLKNVILDNGKEHRDLEIESVKFFKNIGQLPLRDLQPLVGDNNLHPAAAAQGGDAHRSAVGAVIHGVAQHVVKNPDKLVRIAEHHKVVLDLHLTREPPL